jgi:spore coat protein CotH
MLPWAGCSQDASSLAGIPPAFDPNVFHDTRLAMDPADWEALRRNFRENQYYPANIRIDGELVEQVGIRSRGTGSRSGEKPGLRVDINRYVKGQEYHGYDSIVLDNVVQDASLLRERLALAVFEAMRIPTPRIAHTRLTVNDQFWGVYTLVEPVSKAFLLPRLGEDGGNLFEYRYLFEWRFNDRGPDARGYVPIPFEPKTHEDDLDPSGLVAFIRAVSQTPEESFVRDISAYLDVEQLLAYVAVENAIAEHDGFLGYAGMNNLYLYQYAGRRRFVFIPWDKDTSFQNPRWPLFHRTQENVLTRRLLADPGLRKVYTDAVLRAVSSFVNSRWLLPRMEAAYAQIRQAVMEDRNKPYSNAEFEQSIAGLRGIIEARESDVRAQLP